MKNLSTVVADHQVELFEIGTRMKKAGLPSDFIAAAVKIGMEFEGMYDLLKLWDEEQDQKERDELVADIQDSIDDCQVKEIVKLPYIKFNDLDAIAKDVRKFKDSLLEIVTEKGGLKKLSELTNIPQPSLSRFFNSVSMPRRSTLLKIANALKLDAVKISTRWTTE